MWLSVRAAHAPTTTKTLFLGALLPNGDSLMETINFVIAGIGGQGALLVSNVLAGVGVRMGYDVKKTEVHGMSQRGGSVTSHVRWGEKVLSPMVGQGEADFLLALEKLESLRYLDMLRPGGAVLVGEVKIPPISVSVGESTYPDDREIRAALAQIAGQTVFLPTQSLAKQAGNARAHNVVLLGGLSVLLPQVPEEIWLEVVAEGVPARHMALNMGAFNLGRAFALTLRSPL
jgi:indolepyruvate ferredoxin oxidoreductase, beta subunit